MPCWLKVELHPEALVLRVDEAEGVAAEAVHVAVAGRDAAVAHHDGDLVQRLGQQVQKSQLFARCACWCAGRASRRG
jgi:hypothetical protein